MSSVEKQTLTTVVLRCDEPTCTGRIYPRSVVEKALAEYQKKIEEGKALGPVVDGQISLRDASFRVLDAKLKGDAVEVMIETLPNGRGAVVADQLLSEKYELTPTGMGSVYHGRVGKDFVLTGFSVSAKDPAIPAGLKELRDEVATWQRWIDDHKEKGGVINLDVWNGRDVIAVVLKKLNKLTGDE